jgi:hypothetical protein
VRSVGLPLALGLLGLLRPGIAAADEPPAAPETVEAAALSSPEADRPSPSAPGRLALAGGIVTGVWYGAALGTSLLFPDAPGAEELRIPVAGPFMSLAETGCADSEPDCDTVIVVVRAILTTIDAVGQVGGVAMMIESLFLPTAATSGAKLSMPRRESASNETQVVPVPIVTGKDGIGLGVAGRF